MRERIEELVRTTPRGWYNGAGEPINPEIAAALLAAADRLDGVYIYPLLDGGVSLEWGNAEAHLLPDGSIVDGDVELWSWRDDGWADDVLEMMMEQL